MKNSTDRLMLLSVFQAVTFSGACPAPGEEGGGEEGEGEEGEGEEGEGEEGEGEGEAGPPDTTLVSVPANPSSNGVAQTFDLACDAANCTFECSLDGEAFAACSEPVQLDGLFVGTHVFSARAVGNDGLVDASPATYTWETTFGWRSVSSGYQFMCAVAGDGGLYCWGRDETYGALGGGDLDRTESRPLRVGDRDDWREVTSGPYLTCARNTALELWCFGYNDYGMVGDPAIALDTEIYVPTLVQLDVEQLAYGDGHGCGVTAAGELLCWGRNPSGQLGNGTVEPDETAPPAPVVGDNVWVAVSAGGEHTCAIDSEGALFCFGYAGYDVATDENIVVDTPTQVGTATDWQQVSAGDYHTCAIKTDGSLWCFGENGEGQLGSGDLLDSLEPRQVGTDRDWATVQGAENGTCATKVDRTVYCFGRNQEGQIGSTTLAAASTPTPLQVQGVSGARLVAGAFRTRCALTADDLLCWGENTYAGGALGRGAAGEEEDFIEVDTGWASVEVTARGGCGVRLDGTARCFGFGFHLGQAGIPIRATPTALDADTTWTDIDVTPFGVIERAFACGIKAGNLYCWGTASEGQLGDGTASLQPLPVQVGAGQTWRAVSTGFDHTCALTTTDELFCFGGGTNSGPFGGVNNGQVGDGTTQQRNTPVAITTPASTGWSSVDAGGRRTTALRSDGTLWAWGAHNGNAATTPTQLGTDNDWVAAISQQQAVTCAVKENGTLWCSSFVFGGPFNAPLNQVGTSTSFVGVESVANGVCGLDAEGALECYQTFSDNIWQPVSGLGFAVAAPSVPIAGFSGGFDFRCALTPAGARWCAGTRLFGSFGDGVDERVPAPVLRP